MAWRVEWTPSVIDTLQIPKILTKLLPSALPVCQHFCIKICLKLQNLITLTIILVVGALWLGSTGKMNHDGIHTCNRKLGVNWQDLKYA